MAKSRYEYVRKFEREDPVLPNCFIVIRVDGHAFHKFVVDHGYERPNDVRGLGIMNRAAQQVMKEFRDIVIGFGESDEYSFVLRRSCTLYGRRATKLATYVVSLFASSFVYFWNEFFGSETPLKYPPMFDARCVCYPTLKNVRDYLSWRQADTHINNLYNTCFWALVDKEHLSPKDAEKQLCGTDAGQKNELLFSKFGINYAKLPDMFRKGSVLVWSDKPGEATAQSLPQILHVDIIGDTFWKEHPSLLEKD